MRLEKVLPAVYFLFVFCLYFSLLSEPYFTDEQDVFYGAYHIIKGKDIYRSFLSQHMPFSYYIVALVALCGARTVFQFRLGIYLMLAALWLGVYLRHRKYYHLVSLFAMPLLYLTILRTLRMGTTMISDHWQGIGLVLIVLELIRYVDTKEIPPACAGMVALGILLSLGSSFASAYSLFCLFLGMAAVQIQDYRNIRKRGVQKNYLIPNLRLVVFCLAPFVLLGIWYLATGNLRNCYEGVYQIVTELYSKYTGGLGSDPVRVVWETVTACGANLWSALQGLRSAPWPNLLYLATAVGLVCCAAYVGRKAPAAGIAIFLSAVYGGLRGFEGFHGMPWYAQTAAASALCLGWGLKEAQARGKKWMIASAVTTGALAAVLLLDFVVWGGYNLLYPQILQDRTLRCEEEVLDLLTEPDEEVFVCNAPVNSLDVMDLELIPSDACGAISYPYFYEMWGDRQMASIRENRPRVLLYDPDEEIWGYIFKEYAPDFDAYARENYFRLPQTEAIWVSSEYLTEARRRLAEAGYGDRVESNGDDQPANSPVKYLAGQRVETSFTAQGEELAAIRFTAACFYRRSNPTLRLILRDAETREMVSEAVITGDRIADNFFSRCPMSAALTKGKTYTLEIAVERIAGKGDMEFYFTPAGELSLAAEYKE